MANYEATRYDFDGANLTGIEGINTGLIIPWSGTSIPSGFLECDGSAVSRSTYADLFAIIGTTYGVGDGATTFNLPDLTDRVVKGLSPTTNLNTSVAANTVTSTGNVTGNLDNTTVPVNLIGPHSHNRGAGFYRNERTTTAGRQSGVFSNTDAAGGGGAHNHNHNLAFSGDTFDVQQPVLITQYIIKT